MLLYTAVKGANLSLFGGEMCGDAPPHNLRSSWSISNCWPVGLHIVRWLLSRCMSRIVNPMSCGSCQSIDPITLPASGL